MKIAGSCQKGQTYDKGDLLPSPAILCFAAPSLSTTGAFGELVRDDDAAAAVCTLRSGCFGEARDWKED